MTIDTKLTEAAEQLRSTYEALGTPAHDEPRIVPFPADPLEPQTVRSRKLAAAVAAAVVVGLVIGLAALLVPLGNDDSPIIDDVDPVPITAATTSSVETTIAQQAPSTIASAGTDISPIHWATVAWTRVSDPEGSLGGSGTQYAQAVIAGGPGFVAVGSDCGGRCDFSEEDDPWDAAVWTSADGTEWTRVPHDEAAFGGPGSQDMLDVVEAGPGFVAVGVVDYAYYGGRRSPQEFRPEEYVNLYGLDLEFDRTDIDAAVWTSTDGGSWVRVEDSDGVFSGIGDGSSADSGDYAMEAVAVGEGLIVAVGSAHGDAAVWTSRDGVVWERVAHEESTFGGPSGQWMHDVVFTGERFVAVGTDLNNAETGEGIMRGAVWTSEDGFTWSRVENDPAVFGGELEPDEPDGSGAPFFIWAVAVTEDGLVAAGTSPTRMALWRSERGLIWERIWDQQAPFARTDTMFFFNNSDLKHDPVKALLGTSAGVVAVGWDRDTAAVMYLDSGFGFEHDLVLGQLVVETAMTDITGAGGDRLVAVGFSGGDTAVWIGEIITTP